MTVDNDRELLAAEAELDQIFDPTGEAVVCASGLDDPDDDDWDDDEDDWDDDDYEDEDDEEDDWDDDDDDEGWY